MMKCNPRVPNGELIAFIPFTSSLHRYQISHFATPPFAAFRLSRFCRLPSFEPASISWHPFFWFCSLVAATALSLSLSLSLSLCLSPLSLSLYIYIYICAFRPVCCLLFLAEITCFALLGGKEEDLRKTRKRIFGTASTTLLGGGHFSIKLGKNDIFG